MSKTKTVGEFRVQPNSVHVQVCNTGTIEPLITRRKYGKHGYVSQIGTDFTYHEHSDLVKVLYCQLLSDLLPIAGIMLSRESKEIDDYLQAQEDAHFAYVDELLGDCRV